MATQLCRVDDEDGFLRLDIDALTEILSGHENKKLIIVSCVGAMRGGKSTLLSWLVRRAQETTRQKSILKEMPQSNTVFPAAWGRTPCTSGIWGQIVERDFETCWLFLDTQGMFDSKLNTTATSHLFGLTALISSLLIYNVSKRVGEDIIGHAAHFSSLSRCARPVQEHEVRMLEFLVRDWEYFDFEDDRIENHEYLYQAAEQASLAYLENELMGHKTITEMNQNRTALREAFTSIGVSLLPHPGREATRPEFNGSQLDRLDSLFRLLLARYCDSVVRRSEEISTSSTMICGRELYLILEHACEHFRIESPRLESLFASTSRANSAFAAEKAKQWFDEKFHFSTERFVSSFHEAIELFDKFAKFGPEEMKEEYRESVAVYAKKAMERLTQIEIQVKLRRKRIKQAVVATSAGVVLAPFWVPTALGWASRATVFIVTTASSQAAHEVSETTVAGMVITACFVIGSIGLSVRHRLSRQHRSPQHLKVE